MKSRHAWTLLDNSRRGGKEIEIVAILGQHALVTQRDQPRLDMFGQGVL